MLKKIICLGVLLVMCLGLFFGCGNDLDEYKVTAVTAIESHANIMKAKNNYTAAGYAAIEDAVEAGKQAVEDATNKGEVDTAVNDTKSAIDEINEEREMADFVLTVTTSKTIFNTGDEIKVNILLLNQSGKDEEISYYFLITPDIPTATNYPAATEMPQYPHTRAFLNGETISITNDLGGYFAPGQHEIKYNATFYLNWGEANESAITLDSNTIKITVL